ncbi:hypothetical protein SALBM135S_01988 [Streptomyces alboniger]
MTRCLWKLEGLSEYGVRRPMTATGTNLLGLVKHLTGAEAAYFGETFGQPVEAPPLWITGASRVTPPGVRSLGSDDRVAPPRRCRPGAVGSAA